MKKSLIITAGIVLLLLVVLVWGYLLFFGTPGSSNDVFSDLGFGDSAPITPAAPTSPDPDQETDTPGSDLVLDGGLEQLTTRPVAGFGFVATSSSRLRYVERGTGHIFQIDTESGDESRISGQTIPEVVEARFSDSGRSVALIREAGGERTILAGAIPEGEASGGFVTLPAGAVAADFVSDSLLRYAVISSDGSEGYELDLTTEEPLRIFTTPLREITIQWEDETYLFNRPTRHFKGSLYRTAAGLEALTPGEFGFVGGVSERYFFGSYIEDGSYGSYAIDRNNGERTLLPVTYLPEKCAAVAGDETKMWCAAALRSYDADFVEDWYKGIRASEDMLWLVDIARGEAQLYSNFLEVAGRAVDVEGLAVSYDGTITIFRNKLDNTLWMYDARVE